MIRYYDDKPHQNISHCESSLCRLKGLVWTIYSLHYYMIVNEIFVSVRPAKLRYYRPHRLSRPHKLLKPTGSY